MINLRKFPQIFLCMSILFFATLAIGNKSLNPHTLKIYVPGSYTGPVPIVASDFFASAQLFASQVNSKGGLLGRMIEVIAQDDKADVVLADKNAEVALSDPNHLVTIGHNFSRVALPVGKKYAKAGKLFITPFATNPEISKIGGTVFQLCFNDQFQGKVLARISINRLAAKRIAMLINQSDLYSVGLASAFLESLAEYKQKDTSVKSFSHVKGMKDFKKILTEITEFNPDLIFLPEQEVEAAEILNNLLSSPLKAVPVLGSDGWGAENQKIGIGSLLGRKIDDPSPTYFVTHHWIETIVNPKNAEIIKFLKKFGNRQPSGPGVFTFEGLQHLEKIVKSIGTFDGIKISNKMRGSSFSGSTGLVYFNPNGTTERPLIILKVRNGRGEFDSTY